MGREVLMKSSPVITTSEVRTSEVNIGSNGTTITEKKEDALEEVKLENANSETTEDIISDADVEVAQEEVVLAIEEPQVDVSSKMMVDAKMGMIEPDFQDNTTNESKGMNSQTTLWIVIIVCAVLGIVLGIIRGKKIAYK